MKEVELLVGVNLFKSTLKKAMSIYFNRRRFNKSNRNREYKALMIQFLFPKCEEFSEAYFKFLKTRFKRSFVYSSQRRKFRTWKHNRKTQYKQ